MNVTSKYYIFNFIHIFDLTDILIIDKKLFNDNRIVDRSKREI